MASKVDRFAALREARQKGGRLQQWKVSEMVIRRCMMLTLDQPEDADLYDTVTDDQYRSIVGSRSRDDFIEDDDGSGYVDHGGDDWDGAEDGSESEDEDAFDGEDEELKRGASGLNIARRGVC